MARQLGIFFLLFTLAFVGAGIAIALDQIAIAVVVYLVFVFAAVIWIIAASARVRSGNRKLVGMQGTRVGRATILRSEPTKMLVSMGESRYPPRSFRLQLRVELEGRQPYEVTHYEAAYPWDAGHLRAGQVLPCLVHPTKDSMVYLQFERRAPDTSAGLVPGSSAPFAGGGADPLSQIPWPDITPSTTVQAAGGRSIDVDDLLRRTTGSDLQGLLGRVQSGEQVPGVAVGGHGVPDATGGFGASSFTGGHDASAVVNGVRDLGPSQTGNRSVELDLLIAIPGQTPYRVVQVSDRSPARMPRTGDTLRVRVDPARPSEVRLLD